MNSYGQNAKRRQIKNAVREELFKQIEHYDLCMLMTLHKDFGFGAERLRRFYACYSETYNAFKDRYFDDKDVRIFGERGDTYEMREALLKIGFDYDALVKELTEGKKND